MKQLSLMSIIVGYLTLTIKVASGRPLHSTRKSPVIARKLQAADFIKIPLTGLQAATPTSGFKQLGQDVSALANRVPLKSALLPKPNPLEPWSALATILDKVEATLPGLESNSAWGLGIPELSGTKDQTPVLVIDPKLTAAAELMAGETASPGTPEESISTATGMAFNGGKASAKATSKAQNAASSAALATAVAVADRTAAAHAQASSDASNPAKQGMTVAKATTTAVGDKSSLVVSKGGSLAVGLGGSMTASDVTSKGAAAGGSISYVGGTAVSSAGPGSISNTTAYGTAAAEKNAIAAARADSISLGFFKGSNADGTATANSQATTQGIAASQSLLESFAAYTGKTATTSKADATAAKPGVSLVRDKAVGIGLKGAEAAAHTESAAGSGHLGLSVIDSVARAITAGNQKACADAVTKTYSDLASGAQIDLGTFILALEQHADKACVTSFKDHAGTKLAEQQQQLRTFESVADAVLSNTAQALKVASGAADSVKDWVAMPLGQLPSLVRKATWGAAADLGR